LVYSFCREEVPEDSILKVSINAKLNTYPATGTQVNPEQPSESRILDMPETPRKMQHL